MIYTTTELITALKRNAVIPSSQRKFEDSDFVVFMNEELESLITEQLMSLNEGYFENYSDTALVASQSFYDLPQAAAGWSLISVGYLDSDNNFRELPRLTRGQNNRDANTTSNTPSAVVMYDDQVELYPHASASVTGSLRFYFRRLQNKLVESDRVGTIQSISTVGTDYEIVVDQIPTGMTSPATIDVIKGSSPFGLLAESAAATYAVLTFTVATSLFESAPVAGDYICYEGETFVPHIPVEYHHLIPIAGMRRYYAANKDQVGMSMAEGLLQSKIKGLRSRSSDRVKTSPRKIVSKGHIRYKVRGY